MKIVVLLMLLTICAVCTDDANAAAGRKFYLTKGSFDGAHALQACVSGFHMASLWEIYDVSNVRYDRTLGYLTTDSGFGPPAASFGWVRTGNTPDVASTPGIGNCSVWTSNNPSYHGTLIELPIDWANVELGVQIGSWSAGTADCGFETRVWCVQN